MRCLSSRSLLLTLAAASSLTACRAAAPVSPAPAPVPAPVVTIDNSALADSLRLAQDAAARARAEAADAATRTAFAAMIHFAYNQDAIATDDQLVLDQKARILQANPTIRVRITGHADERGSDEYNIALGMRRAVATKRYLEGRGIDGARLEVGSLGREAPINRDRTEAAYAENRRAEFAVIAGPDRLVAPRN